MLARALANLDTMGAKAIGIDILFDQPQDEERCADRNPCARCRRRSRLPMPTSKRIRTTSSTSSSNIWRNSRPGSKGTSAHPASIRLDNTFGATRIWPSIVAGLPPLLGRAMLEDAGEARAAFAGYEGAIDYRRPKYVDAPAVCLAPDRSAGRSPIPKCCPFWPSSSPGKYVLIGGDIVDYDRVETSFTSINGDVPAGIAVHAEIIAQMLDNRYLAPVPQWVLWAMALLVVITAALTALLEWPARRLAPFLVVLFVTFIGIPVLLQVRNVDTLWPSGGRLVGGLDHRLYRGDRGSAGLRARCSAISPPARSANISRAEHLPRRSSTSPKLLSLGGEKRGNLSCCSGDLEGFNQDEPRNRAGNGGGGSQSCSTAISICSAKVVLDHGGGESTSSWAMRWWLSGARRFRARMMAPGRPRPAMRCGRRARISGARSRRWTQACPRSARPASACTSARR